jgi:hypothetical protein
MELRVVGWHCVMVIIPVVARIQAGSPRNMFLNSTESALQAQCGNAHAPWAGLGQICDFQALRRDPEPAWRNA